jgi:nucleotide sugar dehydrogenase
MLIGVIGNGYVGGATALLAHKHSSVYVYDKDPKKCNPPEILLRHLLPCDFIFVAVPTPMDEDGSCSTTIVENVVNYLSEMGYDKERIIIKSTVPVGTCRRLGVMFMPEFLTERSWRKDFTEQKRWILGTNTSNDKIRDEVYKLFESAWNHGELEHRPSMSFSTTEEAELTKYVRNCFLASKVSFFNEINEFCEMKGINYRKVRELSCKDDRVGANHTSVPGPDGKMGFGGTCFPKDISSLLEQMVECGLESYMVEAAKARNIQVDRAEKDWENNKGRAVL